MISLTLGLTIGIIVATAVIVAMCCIIVGAAADPLSRFDRTDELTSDAETQRSVGQGVEGKKHTHFGSASK
jgi:hypothetical protein